MTMTVKRVIVFTIIIFSFPFRVLAAPMQLNVERVGDDKLTALFQAELEQKIAHSREFAISKNVPGQWVLAISGNVKLKKVGNQTKISFRVEFIAGDKMPGISSGNCWQDHLSYCADQVLRDLKLISRQQ